jgi:hypothetical protein
MFCFGGTCVTDMPIRWVGGWGTGWVRDMCQENFRNGIAGSGILGLWTWPLSTDRSNMPVDIIMRDCRLNSPQLKTEKLPHKPEYKATLYFFTGKIRKRKNAVFWNVAPCRYCGNRSFGWTYRLHLQGIRNPLARNQHEKVAATSQKTAFFIVTAVKHQILHQEETFLFEKIEYAIWFWGS